MTGFVIPLEEELDEELDDAELDDAELDDDELEDEELDEALELEDVDELALEELELDEEGSTKPLDDELDVDELLELVELELLDDPAPLELDVDALELELAEELELEALELDELVLGGLLFGAGLSLPPESLHACKITLLHNKHADKNRLLKNLREIKERRPVPGVGICIKLPQITKMRLCSRVVFIVAAIWRAFCGAAYAGTWYEASD